VAGSFLIMIWCLRRKLPFFLTHGGLFFFFLSCLVVCSLYLLSIFSAAVASLPGGQLSSEDMEESLTRIFLLHVYLVLSLGSFRQASCCSTLSHSGLLRSASFVSSAFSWLRLHRGLNYIATAIFAVVRIYPPSLDSFDD